MAKMKYSAPLFKFCPIPLTPAGTGGGCERQSTQAEFVCAIEDPFMGEILFMEYKNGCERIPASKEEANGAACYHVPTTDYNVYNS